MKQEELHELLRQASEATCVRALDEIGPLQSVPVDWQPQGAPGSDVRPATDARRVALLLEGWAKLAVPSLYEDLEGNGLFNNTLQGWVKLPVPKGPGEVAVSSRVSLPDQWPPARHYHHAWYVIRVDLGAGAGATVGRASCVSSPAKGDHEQDARATADQFWLRFDAVAHACAVFVNGREAGRHVGGYTPFEFDITPLVQPGANTIAVWMQDDTAVLDVKAHRAITQLDYGRGVIHAHLAGVRGGIYLETRRPTHVARIRIRPSTRHQALTVETWVRGNPPGAKVKHAVYEWPAGESPVLELPEGAVAAEAGQGEPYVVSRVAWRNPKPWSPAHPTLYVLRTTVTDGERSESFDTRFGFREFWVEGKQFMLNGKPIRLFGDGSHPAELRSIVPDVSRVYDRRWLEFLKEEFNFMSSRLHGVLFPSWAILAADEAGVLLINQSGLRFGQGAAYDRGGEEFMRNLEVEFGEWYWRDVNSPSVVIWDVENELIRGNRVPERVKWVLQLDQFIRKHDPEALIEHSGAGWYKADQQIIHVHMQEQYNRVMRTWRESGKVPLVLGEFWMGGRGETRLPNGYEYDTREDWHREEARIYREQTLEMRNCGACGIMPHRLTHWPLRKQGTLLSQDDRQKLERPLAEWRFASFKNLGARGMAPVVGFVWPRGATVLDDEPFTRGVVVCNDREDDALLSVTCVYGEQQQDWKVSLGPGEQDRHRVTFTPRAELADIVVAVRDQAGGEFEGDRVVIHAIPRATAEVPSLKRRIVVVPELDPVTAAALDELQVPYSVKDGLPADAGNTIVLVPPGARDDALGRHSGRVREYLAAGGRILALAQHEAPKWLPVQLPFGSAVRSSAPEFDQSGWAATNRDLMYSRDVETYAPGHPAFEKLMACDFKEWHPVDGRISDDVFIRPNAVNMRAGGVYRALLGAARRENASLVECRIGRGTAVFCQAQVLETRSHPAARALFANLLRYLDGPAWDADCAVVGLVGETTHIAARNVAGQLSPSRMHALTGIDEEAFTVVTAVQDAPALVLAGDRGDMDLIVELARSGCTVLVLSCETAARLPGYAVECGQAYYSGTRKGAEDHPLFWGVASASFLPLGQTPVQGALAKRPPDARVLLGGHADGHSPLQNDWTVDIGFYGLEAREPAPPIAAIQTVGKGCIIATTIEPWNRHADSHRQLLANLLANAGVAVPDEAARAAAIEIKRTIPLVFDGRLDDWTNDMEDINFSQYAHADPVALTSKDVLDGRVKGDLDFSGLVYFLHDDDHLFVGGIVFSSKKPARITIDVSGTLVCIDPVAGSVAIDGNPIAEPKLAIGAQSAGEVIDTRLLNLTIIHRQTGKPEVQGDTPGQTFELAIPWRVLGFEERPEQLQGRVRLSRDDGAVLQQPAPDEGGAEYLVLQLREGPGVIE